MTGKIRKTPKIALWLRGMLVTGTSPVSPSPLCPPHLDLGPPGRRYPADRAQVNPFNRFSSQSPGVDIRIPLGSPAEPSRG